MHKDRRGFWYYSKREGDTVRRIYCGKGAIFEMLAEAEALERDHKECTAFVLREEKAELAALDSQVAALCEAVDLLARAAMVAAGYHQHDRGEWRKRRESKHINSPNEIAQP